MACVPLVRAARITAWALYDFAVTVFAMNVISRYFGLWITDTHGAPDWLYSLVFALSMGLAAILMPCMGALSDRTGRRLPWLRLATVICVLGTLFLGTHPTVGWGLVWFGLANLGCQLGGVFYDALLPNVSEGRQIGVVSGIGVAVGYIGSATGLWLVHGVVAEHGYAAAFIPTAVLMLAGALPCMLCVREPHPERDPAATVRRVWQQLGAVLSGPTRVPGLGRFLLGSFFAINAINTVIMFMSVYAKRTAGLSEAAIDQLLLVSIVCAMLGAVGSGWLADRAGPRRCVLAIMVLWCIALTLAAVGQGQLLIWCVGPLVGVCLGGTWTSCRAYLVAIGPVAQLGAIFGLFGLVGRAASNVGPLLWGQITMARDTLGPWTDRLALGSMVGLLCIALCILRDIPDARQRVSA